MVAPGALSASGVILGTASFGAVRKIKDEVYSRPKRRAIVRALAGAKDVSILLDLPLDSSIVTAYLNKDSTATRALPVPFRTDHQTVFSSDGRRFARVINRVDTDTPSISLTLFGNDGKQQFSRSWPIPKIEVTRRMVDSVFEVRRRSDAAWIAGDARARKFNQRVPAVTITKLEADARKLVPRFVSRSLRVVLSPDGHVWVGLPGQTPMMEVALLDSTGRIIAAGSLPRNQIPVAGDRSTLWMLSRDEDDLGVLTRYRLR
jgi:hypothetical protein